MAQTEVFPTERVTTLIVGGRSIPPFHFLLRLTKPGEGAPAFPLTQPPQLPLGGVSLARLPRACYRAK